MKDVREIFDKLGGYGSVAFVLNIKPLTAKEIRRRGIVPVKYWPRLVAACKARNIRGVNYDRLVAMHTQNLD
jgi:hypothetical protein